jgi:hypothetical protein
LGVARTIAGLTTLVCLASALPFLSSSAKHHDAAFNLKRILMDETQETLNSVSDLARIPEIQELRDALHDSKKTPKDGRDECSLC